VALRQPPNRGMSPAPSPDQAGRSALYRAVSAAVLRGLYRSMLGSFYSGPSPVPACRVALPDCVAEIPDRKHFKVARSPGNSMIGRGQHEVAPFCGSQFSGDTPAGPGHQILDADSRIPYPGSSVLRSRGDSLAIRRP
jgi:hypothetical protein